MAYVPAGAYSTATYVQCYFLDGDTVGYSSASVYESTSAGSVSLGSAATTAAETSASVYTKNLDITDTYLDSNDAIVIRVYLYNGNTASSQDFR